MELHGALNDFKRSRGDSHLFPGERRSTTGLFSGLDDRLVHVAPDGSLRDYSYPLSGLSGIERSRFGLEFDGSIDWFEDGEQRYVPETAVVETVHERDRYTCRRYDLTIDSLHLTHVVLESTGESVASTPTLEGCLGFAPNGRAGRVGQLRHGDAVEVYHDDERNFFAASTDLDVSGQVPERFEELLAAEPSEFPRPSADDRYEEAQLSPIVRVSVPLTGDGTSATVATLLTDGGDRTESLDRVRTGVAGHADHRALIEAGTRQAAASLPVPNAVDDVDHGFADLRALGLLRAPTGARIAGPEFDPYYRYTGGYGYTWFRDDGEIATFLLEVDRVLDLGLESWHAASARFHCEAQLPDGTWPHRVWAHNGRLAPGWANARLEAGDSEDYQADQTASVATFLATYLRRIDPSDERVRETLAAALEGMDATLAPDGLPSRVQNAWENMTGRFTHTAATYLEAYAAIARAPVDDDIAARARENADRVYEALERLWIPGRGIYALRLDGDDLDDRLDGSTLALVAAHGEYDAIATVDDARLDRLVSHVETTVDGLYRDPDGPVEGLARFEGDPWRVRDQEGAKIWTVTTAWGAYAAAELGHLLAANERSGYETFYARSAELLALVAPGGPLRHQGGYLPEQVFDDGTPDSATPLGWPHAIRLATECSLASAESIPRGRAPASDLASGHE